MDIVETETSAFRWEGESVSNLTVERTAEKRGSPLTSR
jgi:hypothetical protein